MDVSIIADRPVRKEQTFRTPLRAEQQIGLWVDRVGQAMDSERKTQLRILGQYAVVGIHAGHGTFFSPSTGEVPLTSGHVIVLFPDEPHVYYPQGTWTTCWIVWNGPDAEQLERLGYLAKAHTIIDDRRDAVATAFARLTGIISHEDVAAVLERKNIVLQMVLDLFKSTRRIPPQRDRHSLMEQAATFLTAGHGNGIPIADLAERFALSPAHFRRLFKLYTGRSPTEFITGCRISKAKKLLTEGRPIKQVAAALGYDDPFYFMRVFKKATGIPPGRFRAMAHL